MTCCDYREMAENTGGIVVRSVPTSGTPTVGLNVNVTFSSVCGVPREVAKNRRKLA